FLAAPGWAGTQPEPPTQHRHRQECWGVAGRLGLGSVGRLVSIHFDQGAMTPYMTSSNIRNTSHEKDVEHRVVVPADVSMSMLLGPADTVLRAIELGFATLRIHVRGSSITLL